MSRKNASSIPRLMLLFALTGVAVASYDSYAIATGQPLWCPPPIDGCNIVANSPYARFFGVPLGYLGVVSYVMMFTLGALLAFRPFSRALRRGVLVYAAMGVASSICFLFIEITFIHAFCVYCLVSAVLTILLLVAAFVHFTMMWRRKGIG